jgi:outer membrane autotransporter protein
MVVYGETGDVTIDSGTINVGVGSDVGIFAQTTTGNIAITADETHTLVPDYLTGAPGSAVYGLSQSGNITIASGTATTVGLGAIAVGGATAGSISVTSATASTQGDEAWGIYARGTDGGVTVASGDVTTLGAYAHGIHTRAGAGNTSITSTGTVATSGEGAHGIFALGINEASGTMEIDSNSVSVGGIGSNAIHAENGAGDVTIRSGTVTSSGNGAAAIFANTTAGNISITSANASHSGTDYLGAATNDAIAAVSDTGTIAIDSGTTSVAGLYASAIYARGASVSVTSDHVVSSADYAGNISVTATAEGGAVVVDSGIIEMSGTGGGAIDAISEAGNTVVRAATITAESDEAYGILAVGQTGVDVTAGDIDVGREAIIVRAAQSDVAVTATGDIMSRTLYGISIREAGTATVTVEAESTVTGGQIGIFTGGGTLHLTNNGTIRGNGTLDNLDEPPSAGVTLALGDNQIVNNGTISGAGFGISTAYYYNPETQALEPRATGTAITNNGTIRGDANDAIRLIGGGTVTNNGTIAGVAGEFTDGISMFGLNGQDRTGDSSIGSVANNADGQISGKRFGVILSGGGSVTNAGTIAGDGAAIRIQGDETSAKIANVANSGTLTGGVSLGYFVDSAIVTNSGTITAGSEADGIEAVANTVAIDNSGSITAATAAVYAVEAFAFDALEMTNSGTIDGTEAVFAAAAGSSLGFVNTGTIRAPDAEGESGHAVTLSTGYDHVNGGYTADAQTAAFENGSTGVIEGEVSIDFAARDASFVNSGTIRGNPGDSVIDFNVFGLEGAADSVSFANSGQIRGAIEAEIQATEAVFTNSGSIVALGGEDGGEPALDIENLTLASNSVSFTNAAGASITSEGAGGIGVIVQSWAGLNAPEEEGGAPVIGDDPSIQVAVSATNHGSIIANGGGEVTDVSEWGIPGVDTMVTFAGGIGLVGLAPQAEASLTNAATGVIEASGPASIAVYAEAGRFTLNNAGRITGTSGTDIGANMTDGGDYTVIADLLEVGKTRVAGAIQTLDSVDTINNSGTIVGSVDLDSGDDLFVNSGTVDGTVSMGTGNDRVRLETGSVSGRFVGGEGVDTLELAGTSETLTNLQTVAASSEFEQLAVGSGYWVGNSQGVASFFDSVSIAEGATLDVREVTIGGGPASAIVTEVVENNGLLILNFNSDELADIDALQISGTGDVRLDGGAAFVLDSGVQAFTGTAIIANGSLTLAGTGGLSGNVETSGEGTFILGDGGTAGSFEGNLLNNGRFVFDRTDSYDFLGDFSGAGSFLKQGQGTLTFAGEYAFTGTTVIEGGKVKFTGQIDPETEIDLQEGTFDISGTPQTIAQLSGSQNSSINVDNSQLTINQTSNNVFAGAISGDGAIVKAGDGTLNLTGNSTYTGPTTVNGGALAVNGSIVSTVTVNDGGTLKGNGTIGGANITGNGVVAPGNSIGTLHVAGDVNFAAGSVYEVEANAAGQSDQILATGMATIGGGTVQVLAEAGTYRPFAEYLIIRADGGVDGEFDQVTSNFAFLTPSLTYTTREVRLQLVRNDIDFADVAGTANQASTGAALQSLGVRNALFGDVALLTVDGARSAFDALSGEAYASMGSSLLADGRQIVDAVLGAGREASGSGVWASALGDWGSFDGTNGVSGVDGNRQGLIGGLNFGRGGFTIGAAGGASKSDYRVRGRASNADVDTTTVAVRAGYGPGALKVQVGGSYSWHKVDARRSIAFAGFSESASASFDAKTTQLFGEIGYALPTGAMTIEPFARLEHVRVATDGFAEDGQTAALTVGENVREAQFASLGLRAKGAMPVSARLTLEPSISAAWRHGWGDLEGRSAAAFGSGDSFDVVGVRLPKEALDLDLGVGLRTGNVRIGVSYRGILSDQWNSDGAQVSFSLAF